MSDQQNQQDQNLYNTNPLPWSTFLWNLLLGRGKATPVDQIPLPPGRIEEMARIATQGNAADNSERIMNRTSQMTDPTGLVGRMLTPQERAMLGTLIQQLLK